MFWGWSTCFFPLWPSCLFRFLIYNNFRVAVFPSHNFNHTNVDLLHFCYKFFSILNLFKCKVMSTSFFLSMKGTYLFNCDDFGSVGGIVEVFVHVNAVGEGAEFFLALLHTLFYCMWLCSNIWNDPVWGGGKVMSTSFTLVYLINSDITTKFP